MHADICVFHECDMGKLKELGFEFLRYSRPVDSYSNIGNVLIDNNCCERAVRPFTNLRKSFGGFSSENGARVSAAYLTIIETYKLIKKSSLDFLKRYFKMIVAGRRDYEDIMQELLC